MWKLLKCSVDYNKRTATLLPLEIFCSSTGVLKVIEVHIGFQVIVHYSGNYRISTIYFKASQHLCNSCCWEDDNNADTYCQWSLYSYNYYTAYHWRKMGWFLLLCYLPCHVTGLIKGVNVTLKTTVGGQIKSVFLMRRCR